MLIPVILSGGAGSRLWPVSREAYPKPFMKLSDGESLLLKTYQRAAKVAKGGELLTVTNRDYYFLSKDEFSRLKSLSSLSASFLLEPEPRNTAPAIAMAAFWVQNTHGSEAQMLVLSADHLIEDQHGFAKAVNQASDLADQNKLVTFGIVPNAPETGFGYIEAGSKFGLGFIVERFVEKPNREKAEAYLASGKFLWNSGMFCFKASVFLEELEKTAPEIFEAAAECWNHLQRVCPEGHMVELPTASFSAIPSISIDYAVMEGSKEVVVVPSTFDWSDIGSWSALRDLVPPDDAYNRSIGETIFVDSRNTFVQSESTGRLVATVGLDDVMIVDTPDALLVVHANRAQDVKKVVDELKLQGHESYKLHRTVARPWGTYTTLEHGPRFKIKRIEVLPGRSLSLQLHHHRSEHWIVVSGTAKVSTGDEIRLVHTNESTYIPAGHKHRLENPGLVGLVMIEVQSGEYLGEDDIVRFEDAYGRFTGEVG